MTVPTPPAPPAPAPALPAGTSPPPPTAPTIWHQRLGVPPGLLDTMKTTPMDGVKGLAKAQWDAGQHWGSKIGDLAAKPFAMVGAGSVAKPIMKVAGRALPVVGSVIAAGMALDDFKNGDIIGGIFNTIGVIPGPAGWVGMLGAALFVDDDSGSHYGMWEAPDGVTTQMLPAAAANDANVVQVDGALTDIQKGIFGFQTGPTGTVWNSNPPAPLRLDTAEVRSALTTWLSGVAAQFAEIERTLTGSGEPYMAQYQQRLSAHLQAMAALPKLVEPAMQQLTASSDAAGEWYKAMLATNRAARTQLAQEGTLNAPDSATNLLAIQQQSQDRLTQAAQKLAGIGADTSLKPLTPISRTLPGGEAEKSASETPALPQVGPIPPVGAPGAAGGPVKDEKKDDLKDFLSRLNDKAGTPLGGTPLGGMPMGSPLGGGLGGMPMGTPMAGGGQPLQTPTPKPLTPEGAKPKLASSERPTLAAGAAENKKLAAADKLGEKKADTPAPAAAAAAAPKLGEGSEPTPKAASAKPIPPTTVEIKGEKIQFPDAKTAALAKELANGSSTNPVSLADAATKAGLLPPVPGQDPGQQIAPADAKPGDLLTTGDRSYLLLDRDRFLDFSTGKILTAAQLPQEMGSRAGYFHLLDAGGESPQGPVSDPTPATTAWSVDQDPKVPVDPSGDEPVTVRASVGEGSETGSPGVPREGGPADEAPVNAAATDTGRGAGTLSTGSKPLDTTAIK